MKNKPKKKIPEKIEIISWKIESGKYQAAVEGDQDIGTVLAELLVKFNTLIDYLESQEKE